MILAPLFDVVLKTTNTLEPSRQWVGGAESEDSLNFGEISNLGHEISLPQPVLESFVVFIMEPPLILIVIDSVGPPPGVDVEVVERRRYPFFIHL